MIINPMAVHVLFITDGASTFFYKSIVNALLKVGYRVEEMAPKVNLLSEITDPPDVIILFAGETMSKYTDALIFLRDYCIEKNKQIAVLGYSEENEVVKNIIGEARIWKQFLRPLNLQDFAEEVELQLYRDMSEMAKKHILVVDDSSSTLRMVHEWLASKYRVSIANSAAMAISILGSHKVDLIILDVEMPICSGPQLLEMIRAEGKTSDTPVIFLTSKNDVKSVSKVMELNPDGYLLKTLPRDEIISTIDDFFEKQKAKGL